MTAKQANIAAALAFAALLMIGSHVDGQVSMCVTLGGSWEGAGNCHLPEKGEK